MKTHHTCPCCNRTQPLSEFYDRLGKCKSCRAAISKSKYDADPVAYLARQKVQRQARRAMRPPKPRKSDYPPELVAEANKFGLTPKQYLSAKD